MYSESDIEAAVARGAITPAAAAALRQSVSETRSTPLVDEESFRLITGFNDIFVTIAAVLLLVAVGWIGATLGHALVPAPATPFGFGDATAALARQRAFGLGLAAGGAGVASASWALAEYFTRVRRMALPSIVLLASFVYGVAAALFGIAMALVGTDPGQRTMATVAALAGLATAGAAWAHWRRFHVPITIAALTGALVVTLMSLVLIAVPQAQRAYLWLLLAAGLAIFAYAMHWDMSDRSRTTRRSDVAFWLHLSAAPMIAHPVFNLLGVLNGQPNIGTGLVVILLYLLFGVVALAVDRRALLVSSLVYVLSALAQLFREFGAVSLNMALTALVIGSALLLLSAFWHTARRLVVLRLPDDLRRRLPELDRPLAVSPRPAS